MIQVLMKAVDTSDREELERRLEELEARRDFLSGRIKELIMLIKKAEEAPKTIQKLREEMADIDEEYHGLIRLYYRQN